METIRDLKRRFNVYNDLLKVNILSINPSKSFSKEYENWDEFIDDDSIDNLNLFVMHCIDIFEESVNIWIE